MNLKCKLNIKLLFFMLVAIDFNENLVKNYGCSFFFKWTHNGLLKWWHYVCQICGFKYYGIVVSK
jgi:hypothetical protein